MSKFSVVFFATLVVLISGACSDGSKLYNRLGDSVWFIDEYQRIEYDRYGDPIRDYIIFDYGSFSFEDNSTGWYLFDEGGGWVSEGPISWANTQDEVYLTLDRETTIYEVVESKKRYQLWETEYVYNDGSYDVVYMSLSR